VFFVGKKDGGKWMVMDYCKLNKQTVKNNYLLPLITSLVDTMGSKSVMKQPTQLSYFSFLFLFFFFSSKFTEAWERMSHMMSQITGSHGGVGN